MVAPWNCAAPHPPPRSSDLLPSPEPTASLPGLSRRPCLCLLKQFFPTLLLRGSFTEATWGKPVLPASTQDLPLPTIPISRGLLHCSQQPPTPPMLWGGAGPGQRGVTTHPGAQPFPSGKEEPGCWNATPGKCLGENSEVTLSQDLKETRSHSASQEWSEDGEGNP